MRLGDFSWHIGDAAVDTSLRRKKSGPAVSAVVDRHAFEQHELLWTSGRPVLTPTVPVSSERINGHSQLLD
jgi:hypothetical protein